MARKLIVCILLLSGCSVSTITTGSAVYAAPSLGIYTDPDLKVIAFRHGSPAEAAGMQVGDVLVDIRPTGEALNVIREQVDDFPEDEIVASFRDENAIWKLLSVAQPLDETATAENVANIQTAPAEGEPIPAEVDVYLLTTPPFFVRVEREGKTVELEMPAAVLDHTKSAEKPVDLPEGTLYW